MRGLSAKGLSAALLLFLASCGIHSVAWDGTTDSIEESFNVKPGGRLTVEADLGSIEVKTSTADRVEVEVVRGVNATRPERVAELRSELRISMDQAGNDVHVVARLPHRGDFWHGGWNRYRLRFLVTVPRVYNVDLKTSGGAIDVSDLEGRVKSETSGGPLRFGEIRGPVWGRTSGGGITLTGCVGDADVETSGGGINIGEVDGTVRASTSGGPINIKQARGDVEAETSGGGIHVEEVRGSIKASTSGGGVFARLTEQPQGDCRLQTSGGSIEVELASDIRANLDAETSGGRVRVDFPVTLQGEMNSRSVRSELNGGGPDLYLRTSGGGIRIRRIGATKAERD
jgi:DUF4097 and DUF4098 domain-containing protein YvlB